MAALGQMGRLYIGSGVATRPAGTPTAPQVSTRVETLIVTGPTQADAEAYGLDVMRGMWPPASGWTHQVRMHPIPKVQVQRWLAVYSLRNPAVEAGRPA